MLDAVHPHRKVFPYLGPVAVAAVPFVLAVPQVAVVVVFAVVVVVVFVQRAKKETVPRRPISSQLACKMYRQFKC